LRFFLKNKLLYWSFILLGIAFLPADAMAYIGPGAGFAVIGSALAFLAAFLVAFLLIIFWPFRMVWKKVTGKKISKNAKARRVIVVGLDGLDPRLTSKYMREGRLPNFTKLRKQGCYKALKTTCPSISPVAWSTFQTGVNPGSHNIYDFLTRDKKTYLPVLSSSSISPVRKTIRLGRWQIPVGKPEIKLLRKSKPFWKVLGDNGVFCNVLRVPITFPPEKFNGNILSAMCTPDLKGTQGTFTLYTSDPRAANETTGGNQIRVDVLDGTVQSYVEGPDDPTMKEPTPLKVPFSVIFNGSNDECILKIGGKSLSVKKNEFTDWIDLRFKTRLGFSIRGICRFCLRQIYPHFELYVSPINISPDSPALPVSQPSYYSKYLAKLNGSFGTLGLAEDTWALNEQALDDNTFLKQAWLTHAERERMFFDALEKTREGVCVCVFDASDRIQHMFWRYLEEDHPGPKHDNGKYKNVIPELYDKMDDLIGRAMKKLNHGDVLFVLSDHGFKSFRRCVNVNTWLWKNGYLNLKDDRISGKDYFGDVDWARTKAFAIGMGAIFLNMRERESRGIVDPSQATSLKQEISQKLIQLTDPLDGKEPIKKMYDAVETYRGPYSQEAPDLTIGWEDGYRASWECVTGKLKENVFEDNTRAWSGDHCVDADIVPGVFFANRKITTTAPGMVDIAPTILNLFDIKIPKYMEGEPLSVE
jgi:predicted AlkP superfamily phosphohydrolase/phosphomutase